MAALSGNHENNTRSKPVRDGCNNELDYEHARESLREFEDMPDSQTLEQNAEDDIVDDKDVRSHSRCCWCCCCSRAYGLAYTSLILRFFLQMDWVIGFYADGANAGMLGSVRLIRLILPLTDTAGIYAVDDSNAFQHDRGFCSCLDAGIPGAVLVSGAIALIVDILYGILDPGKMADEQDAVIKAAVAFFTNCLTIVFGVRFVERQRRVCPEKTKKQETTAKAESQKERFAAMLAQESRKFLLIYIVGEAACTLAIAISGQLSSDTPILSSFHESKYLTVHLSIASFCLAIRMHRYCVSGRSSERPTFDTLLEAFAFSWNAMMAGLSGDTHVASFALNLLLTYAVITFLPFWRAILIVPVSYASYCMAAAYGERLILSDALLLGLGLVLHLGAKRMIEGSKFAAFVLLEDKAQQAVHEKVLRCQAEFEKDTVLSGLCHGCTSGQTLHSVCEECGAYDPPGSLAETSVAHAALSLHSAPTLLLGGLDTADSKLAKHANCLPCEALVWLEGEAVPRKLNSIEIGDRILCYDRLGGSARHAAISEVKQVGGKVTWTTVMLEDGTSMKMTVDHPVQPVQQDSASFNLAGPWNASKPVNAGDLRPGLDSLLVLKVLPVKVLSTEFREEIGTRIALSVSQPERHAIFVAPEGQTTGPLRTMAVESNAISNCPHFALGARKSFLSIEPELESQHLMCHAKSAPASLCGCQSSCMPSLDKARPLPEDSHSMVSSSMASSSVSSHSLTGSNDEIIIGIPQLGGPNASAVDGTDNALALSAVLEVKNAGLASHGSRPHEICECRPCAFDNRRQFWGTKACAKGSLCNFCHEPHSTEIKKAKRQAQRKFLAQLQRKQAWEEAASNN